MSPDYFREQEMEGVKSLAEMISTDPLSRPSRRSRMWLLGVSLISVLATWGGMTPLNVTLLGIAYSIGETTFLWVLLLVNTYFFLSFSANSWPDIARWRADKQYEELRQYLASRDRPSSAESMIRKGLAVETKELSRSEIRRIETIHQDLTDFVRSPKTTIMIWFRYAISLYLPFAIGLASILFLILAIAGFMHDPKSSIHAGLNATSGWDLHG